MASVNAEVTSSSPATCFDNEQDSGLEVEQRDLDHITDPFDPEQIKIRTVHIVIEQLVSRIRYGEIDLTPEFQRLRGIWSLEQKSRLVESLMLRIPIPVFYVAAQENDNWFVVDGLQRMSTVDDYVNGRFPLEKLEYLTSLNQLKHDELPRHMQRRISETQLLINVIDPGTPPEVMFNVFLRINTGGMRLNGQEIRHALHSGPIRDFLRELAESEEFLIATDRSIPPTRMADRECVLRFLAFHIAPLTEYSINDLDSYLSNAMKTINKMNSDERDTLASNFKKAMTAAYAIFEQAAFRKQGGRPHRSPVSRALFEVWSVQLARYSPEQISTLVGKRDDIRQRFSDLMNSDRDFDRAISYSTGAPQRVHKRFNEIGRLLEDFSNA